MRIEKVNELIKRELSHMILYGDIHDPRVFSVTIMSVDVSKDLSYARVKFSILNNDPQAVKTATQGLNSCRGFIRRSIGQKLLLRMTPEFQFIFDRGAQYAAHIDAALEEIKRNTAVGEIP